MKSRISYYWLASSIMHVAVVASVAQWRYVHSTPPTPATMMVSVRVDAEKTQALQSPAPSKATPAKTAPPTPAIEKRPVKQAVVKPNKVAPIAAKKPSIASASSAHKGIGTQKGQAHSAKRTASTANNNAASAVVTQPHAARYLNNPAPAYPASAKRKGQQGTTLLNVSVTAQGQVSSLHILRSSGHLLLDKAAVRAVKQWKFIPATQAGKNVAARVNVPITFALK
jgi:periplasmic protein TonB